MRQRFWHLLTLGVASAALWSAALLMPARSEEPERPAPASPTTEAADSSSASPAEDSSPVKPSTTKPMPVKSTPESSVLPGEVEPKIFYLKDRDGNLQAMPGILYEQFMEAWKQQHQLGQDAARPAFSIQNLAITGTAAGASAELIARFTVTVHEAGWVGVPLRLNDAVLREKPTYEGEGDYVLHADPQQQGYVVWIRGPADSTHQVTVKFVTAVEQIGPQSRLQLSLPRSTVSQLQLQVPLAQTEAKVSDGSRLDSVRALAGGKTELKVLGLGGEFELAWHPADRAVASLPTILEVSGTQLIRLNGRSISTEAKLRVSSLGSEFDYFQVRLPPGADYVGTSQSGVSLVAVNASATDGKLYEVKLDKKTIGPIEVRLVTERAHNSAQADEMLQLAGFEVPGAVRQWGTIGVQVEGNWQIVWGEANHVQPVDEVRGVTRRDDLAAGFEYFVQPYSLTARVVPQKTRIRVEPEYVLLIGSEEAQLRAKLKYTIRGAKVRLLDIHVPGWQIDSIGPDSLVNVDAADPDASNSLTIPLLQAASGELELTFVAHQKLSPGAGGVSLELPRPQGDVVAADVAVVTDDNVELVLQPNETTALAPQAIRPQLQLPDRQRDPLFFRTTGPAARFVAAMKLHEQSISAAMTTQLDVGPRETRVDERIVFQVAYQPADHFLLTLPRGLRADRVTILHDGTPLTSQPARPRSEGDNESVPLRVNLPSPRIGRCELQIGYAVRHEKIPTEASTPVSIPLIAPAQVQITANDLVVVPQSGLGVTSPPGPWSQDTRSAAVSQSAALTLSAKKAVAEITLALSSKQNPVERRIAVERGWIQTRLTNNSRQDRAVFRVSTNQPQLQIRLPEGADTGAISASVDGRSVTIEGVRQRDLTIALPGTVRSEHTVELRYHFSVPQSLGSLNLVGPQVLSADWVQQLYWQLVLPPGEHVLMPPQHFTEESTWVWSDLIWQRQPTLEQAQLESWIGAGADPDSARLEGETAERYAARQLQSARATNRYLFSTVGTLEPLQVYTMNRARLVLLASLPMLLLGLGVIYFPTMRHPAVLFGVAIAVAVASLIAPQSSLLLAQASILGLALIGVAMVLSRLLPRIAPPAPSTHGSSLGRVERGVTELYQRPPSAGLLPSAGPHPASTTAEPLVPTSADAES